MGGVNSQQARAALSGPAPWGLPARVRPLTAGRRPCSRCPMAWRLFTISAPVYSHLRKLKENIPTGKHPYIKTKRASALVASTHLEHLECSHLPHTQGRGAKKRTQRAGW